MLEFLRVHGDSLDAVICPGATYFWPDVVFKRITYPPLSYPLGQGSIRPVDMTRRLEDCLRAGARSPKGLAGVYHGVVRRSVLGAVRERSGAFFPGPSPDMANAISVSLLASRVVELDFPLLIDGFGFHSAGGRGVRGEHKAKLSEVAQIPADTADTWHDKIPLVWLGSTIWAQSCVTALLSLGRPDLLHRINWPALYGSVLVNHFDCRRLVLQLLNHPKIWAAVVQEAGTSLLQKGTAFVKNVAYAKANVTTRKVVRNQVSLREAVELVSIDTSLPSNADRE